jgi:dihydrofolate reductase
VRIVLTENITLDGVVEATEGWFGPAGDHGTDESDILVELRRQSAQEDGLLVGRVTFEDFRSYWPHRADDTTGISEHLDRVRKYVVSGSLGDPRWENTAVLRGPLFDEVRALREAPGRDLCVTGSISVAQQLVDADLIDEYRLFVYPVVLGRGRRLFADGVGRCDLELVGTKPFRSGVVLLAYHPRSRRA